MSRNAAAGCNTGGSRRLKPAPRKWSSARIPASRLRASVGGTGRIAFTRYFLKFEASFNKGAAWTQPFSRSKVNLRPGPATPPAPRAGLGAEETPRQRLDAARATLSDIDVALKADNSTDADLARLRAESDSLASQLQAVIVEL